MMDANSPHRRILWICYSDLGSALDKATWLEISKCLHRSGYEVSLVTPSAKLGVRYENVRIISIPFGHHPLIANAMYSILLLFFLPFYVVWSKYDFIIAHSGVTSVSLMPLFVLPRSQRPIIILDSRSPPIFAFGIGGYVKKLAYIISFFVARKFFDGITTITPMMKEEICARFNLEPTHVGVWTSGTSSVMFDPQRVAEEGISLRARFGLGGKFVVFHHGSLSLKADRGIAECIAAIEIIKSRHADVVLFLLGAGETSVLREEILRRKIQDKVIIYGPVEYRKVPEFIAMSDVAIVPLPNLSQWRNQCPLKLLEYLAMEKVVIATDVPANKYIVGNSSCGIFIPTANSEEIAGAIAYAYDNKDSLSNWGLHGRTIIKERYIFERVAEDLKKYLAEKEHSAR
jgi:glycosyltransferase involved in cell wall biosynthesis